MIKDIHKHLVSEIGSEIDAAVVMGVKHFKIDWPQIVAMAEKHLGEGQRTSLPISMVVSELNLRHPEWKIRHTPSYSVAPILSHTTIYFDKKSRWDKQGGNNGK